MTAEPSDVQLLTAIRHPWRRGILRHMYRKGAISPKEISGGLGMKLSNVAYHVRVLAEHDAITLVRTQQVRGATEHFYCFDIDSEWVLVALGLSSR